MSSRCPSWIFELLINYSLTKPEMLRLIVQRAFSLHPLFQCPSQAEQGIEKEEGFPGNRFCFIKKLIDNEFITVSTVCGSIWRFILRN